MAARTPDADGWQRNPHVWVRNGRPSPCTACGVTHGPIVAKALPFPAGRVWLCEGPHVLGEFDSMPAAAAHYDRGGPLAPRAGGDG